MGEGHKVEAGRFFGRMTRLMLIFGTLAAYGCSGDTLYDAVSPEYDAPVIEIVSPGEGAAVLAGQRVPIEVSGTDEEGVSSITLRISGVVSETIFLQFTPPRDSVAADTAIVIPAGSSGNIQISASGVNTRGLEGQATAVGLTVTNVDALAPYVSLTVDAVSRMELTDEIKVTIQAYDNPGGTGIARTELIAIVKNTDRADTLVLSRSQDFVNPVTGTATSEYRFAPPFVDPLALPDTLMIFFSGVAYDDIGNCSGAVASGFTDQIACDTALVSGGSYVVANAPSDPTQIVAVSGRTSPTVGGGTLADLLIDPLRSRVYVSNLSRNRIQIMDAGSGDWGNEVWVSAEPWGLAVNPAMDTLFVGNSGGTSISFVSIVGAAPFEDQDRRLVTKNNALFEIGEEAGKLTASFYDFSDRPQFIAQDAAGRLIYSTRPTGIAQMGTVRQVTTQPGWVSPENRILVFGGDLEADPSLTAIAHVDSVYAAADGSCVQIWDHKPGFPQTVVSSGCLGTAAGAVAAMQAQVVAGNSDMWAIAGSGWKLERLALRDTTFVTASGDREWVAIGEGGGAGEAAGRITLWNSGTGSIHSRLLVTDLVNNASERVTGLELNQDGSLGSASGGQASYYWSTDLRLQGSVSKTVPGGAGATLHPSHPSFLPGLPSSELTLSFVGQADNTVRILDTSHFTERGQLHIRDVVTGPLKAGLPLPTDNNGQGAGCVGQDCVVVKLYGITDGGGVVVVDVRRRDISDLF